MSKRTKARPGHNCTSERRRRLHSLRPCTVCAAQFDWLVATQRGYDRRCLRPHPRPFERAQKKLNSRERDNEQSK